MINDSIAAIQRITVIKIIHESVCVCSLCNKVSCVDLMNRFEIKRVEGIVFSARFRIEN